jgi:hypothetical protein
MEFEDIDEQALMMRLRSEVDPRIHSLVQIGSSSNLVYRAEAPEMSYGLRIPRLDPAEFSAFWEQVRSIYGHDYTSRPASPDWITKEIRGAGLDAPEQLTQLEVNGRRASVVAWMGGAGWVSGVATRFPLPS